MLGNRGPPSYPNRSLALSTIIEAARIVLQQAGQPLRFEELAKRILDERLWQSSAKSPATTVHAHIAAAIKHDPDCPIVRTAPGTFALRGAAAVPPPVPPTPQPTPAAAASSEPVVSSMSFTEAAEHILKERGAPMHYAKITSEALRRGLIQTAGRTPEATMNAQIIQETQRRGKRGEKQRFDRKGEGIVGLVHWKPMGLQGQIANHNASIRKALRERLFELDPAEFEALVGRLLTAIGFEEVTVTRLHGDGGVDVRGTLIVGDAIRIKTAVQAKRWKRGNNVLAPTVQTVRGSLSPHEQGLIITTSEFSAGAKAEALRPDATPVGLLNGEGLVSLLVEHEIMVRREQHEMLQADFG
jgi:restriction system protein